MAAAGTADSLQATVSQTDDAGLDGLHTLVGLDEGGAPPGLTHVVGQFEVELPAIAFVTGRRNEPPVVQDGLVLDGSIDTFGQPFASAPRLAAVF